MSFSVSSVSSVLSVIAFFRRRSGETPKPRSRARRILRISLRIVLGVYFGLAILLAAFQTYLIFPGAATQGRADSIVRPFAGSEIVELRAKSGDKVVAMFGPAMGRDQKPRADANTRPTILYFYGNGMCMADCEGEFLKFRHRGFNVMVPDFVGYGMSGGKPSEQGVYATADAAFEHLLSRGDIDKDKIVPMGWSLGAAAAIHVASTRKVPCLVTVSAFTSMGDMGQHMFPFMPTRLLLRHHFENEQKIRDIRVPIFMAHGTNDDIIPFAMHGRLIAAAGGPVTKYVVEGGKHNDVFDVGGEPMMDAIAAFVDEHAR